MQSLGGRSAKNLYTMARKLAWSGHATKFVMIYRLIISAIVNDRQFRFFLELKETRVQQNVGMVMVA